MILKCYIGVDVQKVLIIFRVKLSVNNRKIVVIVYRQFIVNKCYAKRYVITKKTCEQKILNEQQTRINTHIYTCCCFYFWKIVLEELNIDLIDFSANNKTEFYKNRATKFQKTKFNPLSKVSYETQHMRNINRCSFLK